MKIIRPFVLLSLTLFSCSSLTKTKLSPETDVFIDYIKATHEQTLNPEQACRSFFKLSNDTNFILKDVAYIRSGKLCANVSDITIDWTRPLPSWLDGEKKLLYFGTLTTPLEKGLFVKDNPGLFKTPERILYYQSAIATKSISSDQKILLEKALFSLSPRFMPKPQDSDFLRIAKDYRSVRQFQKSYDYLNKIVKGSKTSKDDKMAALKELFVTHKLNRLRNKKNYIQAAKKWANFLSTKDLENTDLLPYYYEAQVNLARVLWTEQSPTEALATLATAQKNLEKRHSLFDVYWLRGRIFEEQKKTLEAQTEYLKATLEPTPSWKEKEKIIWSLAWSFFKNKDYLKSIEQFEVMINHPEISTTSRFKYLYWKGESLQRQSLTEEAKQLWEELAEADIYGYYGLLAHHQVGRPLKPILNSTVDKNSVLTDSDAKIFNALIKVEEIEFAQKMLVDKMEENKEVLQMSVDDICALFEKLSLVNSFSTIFTYFTKLPYDTQKAVFNKIPKILFPSPYLELVTKAAQDASIEAELIYSIMRQESSFNPMARSPMDAFGLLQILPEVAKVIARQNKIPFRSYEDLYKPEINLPIGAHLLRKQNAAFDKKFVLMVASYNASSRAVRSWYDRFEGDDLIFIEDIPYEETKAYVKLVTRNLVLYKKLLYGDEFRDFPRHLLEL